MTLSAGTRLGPFEIVAPLGAGGMGENVTRKNKNYVRIGHITTAKVAPA
jgi:hypothetical protein